MRRSARILARNPVLLVPNVAIGAAAGALQLLVSPKAPDDLPTSHAGLWAADAIGVAASVASLTVSTGMADAAWKTGRARLRDGVRPFRTESGHTAVAMVATGLAGCGAAALAPYTAFLSMVVWTALCIYAPAAAVAGDREGFLALRESAGIALARPVTTLLLVAALGAVLFVAAILSSLVGGLARAGAVAAGVVTEASLAYVALVTIGEYETLRVASAGSDGLDAPDRE